MSLSRRIRKSDFGEKRMSEKVYNVCDEVKQGEKNGDVSRIISKRGCVPNYFRIISLFSILQDTHLWEGVR